MRTLVKGQGEESYIWYHVVHYDQRDGEKHFAKKLYLHIGDQSFGFYLSLFTSLALIDVQFSGIGDEDFHFSLAIYKLFYFGFSIERLKIVRKLPGVKWNGKWGSGEREIRLSWQPWSWHWNVWTYPHESRGGWRDDWFDLADFLLGREKYSETKGETEEILIPMPEGNYPAKLTFVQRCWKRPRWWKTRTRTDADVEMIEPIPIPGKGENSYDLDDDALYGVNCVASTIDEAIMQVQESAYRNRHRYGGENWIPNA